MESILTKKKLSKTKFRLELLEIFNKYPYALSNDDLEKKLIDFDRITLYRTIKIFIEKGVLHEISISNQVKKYALCIDSCESSHNHQHDHVHFNCDQCKQLYCLKIEQYPSISIANHQVQKVEIQLEGICENCLKVG